MAQKTSTIAIIAVVILIIAAAGVYLVTQEEAVGEEEEEEEEEEEIDLKIGAMITGLSGEIAFDTVCDESLETVKRELEAEGYKVEVDFREKVDVPESPAVMREFGEKGYDIVYANAFRYGTFIDEVAGDYPDTWYFCSTGYKSKWPNTSTYDIMSNDSGYLLGILAGMMTKTNTIGVILPFPVPDIKRNAGGFIEGAKSVNPDVEVLIGLILSWDDVVKAKEVTLVAISEGADFIFNSASGQCNLGVTEACVEKGVYVMHSNEDAYEQAPSVYISSQIINYSPSIKASCLDRIQGENIKEVYWNDLKNGGLDIAPFHAFEDIIPQEVKDKIEEARGKILTGELEVPRYELIETEYF